MNELALFAGAGGGLLASRLLNWRTICAVEINEHCRHVLSSRQNDGSLEPFPVWDDVKTFDGRVWRGRIDVITGGFPCQPFSTASRGRRVAENLWPSMLRVIREVLPRYVFAENVSKKAIQQASSDLWDMGYETEAISLGAADVGGDHIRERFWLLAYADNKGELLRGFNAEMAERQSIQNCIWEAEPSEPRVVNGVANRVDRYTATGNGQIPAVAAEALLILVNN